jgi:hypothetical protein
MFGANREIMEQMFSIPKWKRRFDRAKSVTVAEKVLIRFCVSQGYEVHHEMPSGKLRIIGEGKSMSELRRPRPRKILCGREYCPNSPMGRRHPGRACIVVYHCVDAC